MNDSIIGQGFSVYRSRGFGQIVRLSMFSPADLYVPQCAPDSLRRRTLLAWGGAALVLFALVSLILAAPLLLSQGSVFLAQTIYQAFGYVCHQIPERSFSLRGHSFAVCARCTGLYSGLAAGVWLYPLLRPLRSTQPPARFWLLVATAPIVLDFSLGFLGVYPNTHLSRFITGAVLGSVAALFIVPGLVDLSRMSGRRFFGRRSAGMRSAAQVKVAAAVEPGDYH